MNRDKIVYIIRPIQSRNVFKCFTQSSFVIAFLRGSYYDSINFLCICCLQKFSGRTSLFFTRVYQGEFFFIGLERASMEEYPQELPSISAFKKALKETPEILASKAIILWFYVFPLQWRHIRNLPLRWNGILFIRHLTVFFSFPAETSFRFLILPCIKRKRK